MDRPSQRRLSAALSLISALLLLAACSRPGITGENLISPPLHCQVGVLLDNHQISDSRPGGYCVAGKYLKGSPQRLSRINLFSAGGLSKLVGKQIVVEAQARDDLYSRLQDRGPCSDEEPFPVQFRGDRLADEGGYRSPKEQLHKTRYLQSAGKPQVVNMVQIKMPPRGPERKKSGTKPETVGQVVVTLSNPFNKPLKGLKVISHYEGGRGKPMPHYREQNITLQPGQKLVIQVPSAIELDSRKEKSGAWYRFHTATLAGQAGGCTFWPNTPRR